MRRHYGVDGTAERLSAEFDDAFRLVAADDSSWFGAPSGDLAAAIVNGMRQRRVLISATGRHGNVLKIRPPLPFCRQHADQFLGALREVLAAVGPG